MERLIISGATGYIGIHLTAELVSKYNVYAIVRRRSKLKALRKYIPEQHIIVIDDERNNFYQTIKDVRPKYFVHLAGKFVSNHSQDDMEELLESNFNIPVKMLDAICLAGCKNIINTGSYWQNYNGEIYNPVNFYAASKQAFSDMIKYYTEVMGCKSITLKLFDTYGPNDSRKKVLNLIRNMKDGEVLDMTSCTQKVYYCYIDDVVVAFIKALQLVKEMEPGASEIYSVREKDAVPLKDVVIKLKEITGKDIRLNFGSRPDRCREIMEPGGIGEVLPGWRSRMPLEAGLKMLQEGELM